MNRREIFDRVKRATVAVVAMNNEKAQHPYTILGSGFCVDPAGRIMTCRHVIEALMEKTAEEQLAEASPQKDETGIQKLPSVGVIIPFAVFYVTNMSKENLYIIPCQALSVAAKTDYDLAIMQIRYHNAFSGEYPFLEIEDYEELAEGDEIGTCGFPLGNYLYDQLGTVASSFTTGVISSIIPYTGCPKEHVRGFQLSLTATHGNSGGPVFSLTSGKVFGVLQRGVQQTSGALLQGIAKAEPVYPILTAKMHTWTSDDK